MTGGDGPNSYAKNSIQQRGIMDAAKELLSKAIAEKLDLDMLLSSKTFHIADLGCSVGPNTFLAVENILEAVELKYHQSHGGLISDQIPEFQVFFSDHTLNDFNMLFKSLPQNRKYHAVGVPGSFYGRLFPNASIHFFHSSLATHWLSRVPKEVMDKNSPAWNKWRIHYSNSKDEVVKAYETQYAEDMECFLHARAQEIVPGGLTVLTVVGGLDGTIDILGSCLVDLVGKGVVSEEKVDSFNVPAYFVSPQELKAVVERNGCFSIERLETVPHHVSAAAHSSTASIAKVIASTMRAALGTLIKQQFGDEILDDLFNLYQKKLEDQISIPDSKKSAIFFVVLKRKTIN